MRYIKLLVPIVLLSLFGCAAPKYKTVVSPPPSPSLSEYYQVPCPKCKAMELLQPVSGGSNGSYATNQNGVNGFMRQESFIFKCNRPKCGYTFSAQGQDEFVPSVTATPIVLKN